jgi:hypothetical protein
LQSDNNKFSRRKDRKRKMVTEGHECGGRGYHQQMSKEEIEKEIAEIRARMEQLALKMQQDARTHWV